MIQGYEVRKYNMLTKLQHFRQKYGNSVEKYYILTIYICRYNFKVTV